MKKYLVLLASALMLMGCQLDYSDNNGAHKLLQLDATQDVKDGIRRAVTVPGDDSGEYQEPQQEEKQEPEERIIHREISEDIRETESSSGSYDTGSDGTENSDDIIWEYN